MNKSAQEFDPHEILLEHKKFFEDHRAAFSPLPKRILTPTESDNKIPSMHPSDHGNYYSVMPKQNEALSGEHQNYSVESPEGKNKELLIMTIEIGDGNKDTLRVFEHDDPYELAKRFCETHDLNPKIVEPLAQNIYANMEKVLEERAEALDGEKEEQAPAKESEFESFKDTGMRTGEFKSFSDIGQEQKHLNQHHNTYQRQQQQQQQQQRQQEQQEQQLQSQIQQLHQYYQQQQRQQEQEQQQQQQYKQLPLQQYHKPQINNKENRELEYSKEKDHHDAIREYEPERSVSHANRSSDIAQTPWESPEKQLLAQRGFHMRSSFDGKVQKNRNSQNTTNIYEGTTHEDLSRNQTSKPLDTTNRRSYFDYPSDPRLHNASYIPESFQNEEEYLEYLITSQYGGNQKHEVKNTDYTFTPNINRSSKVMLENKYQNSRLNVYDRLHNHARNKVQNKKNTSQTDISPRKSTGPASRKSTRQNSTDNSRGAGTGLYYRGMKRKEEVKRMLEDFKQERTIEEDRSCTFKPYINPISSEIVNSKPKYERTEDTLINYGRATQEKLERARSVKKVKEVEGCTFQPMINSISAKLVYEREGMSQDAPKDRFTKLFHDHKVRQAQQEMRSKALSAQEGCTFSPMINSHSEAIIDRTNFVDRARKFENKISKIENLRREREEMELFDAETGQPLFRPSVGRPPKQEKRERKQSIGDYLYNQRFEKENLRKSLCEQEKKQRDSQIIRTSEKSQMIMENIQRNKLQAIFSLLDSDEDGYISSSRIDIGSLGTHTLEAFAPLLCEMEELDQTLSLQDFIEAAEKLLKTLPVHERDMIIMSEKFERRSSQPVKFPFHPEINRKSSKLAQGQRPYGNFEALYDHYMGEQKVKEDKLKQEQEKKKQEELKDCSFKPMLMPESNMPLISMNNYNYYYVDHLI